MGEASRLADWRVRAASRLGAAAVCALAFALLVNASRTFIAPERPALGVEVLLEPRPQPPSTPQRQRPPVAGPATPSELAAPQGDPSVETQMLSRMLRCVRRPAQARPADCPREAAPEDWARPQIPMGGDYAQEPEPDMERLYTRAERETLVMPSCIRDKTSGACMRFGQRPPPPSRSAEQICREGGLGGPCTPPPDPEPRR